MLTEEEIKKIFDNFEVGGYALKEYSAKNIVINFSRKYWSIDYNIDTDAWVYDKYGDFLQRVRTGIADYYGYKKNKHFISIEGIYIWVYTDQVKEPYYAGEDTEENLEKAIKYILERLE